MLLARTSVFYAIHLTCLSYIKACKFPQFGYACNESCHCLNNSACNHIDGKCGIGLCEPGWQGESFNYVNYEDRIRHMQVINGMGINDHVKLEINTSSYLAKYYALN